jgi:presenilin-like A22 family membrane protease
MKHSLKITLILLGMFLAAQLIGLAVIHAYSPQITQVTSETGELVNVTIYNLPYGTNPPVGITPEISIISIVIAFFIAVLVILLLMKINAEFFLRLWFFFVVTIALGVAVNSVLLGFPNSSIIALVVALPFAFLKVFKRNMLVHNVTELLIYPGIAAIFVPLLSVWAIVLLLILISIYDMYAVWHSGIMQKMAKYQIQKVRVFAGFFVPYISAKDSALLKKLSPAKLKNKKVKVSVGILGGGDVVFPMILAGVVLNVLGLIPALIVTAGATLGLAFLFYISEKGKFYPAMPFISAGCLLALGIAYLL